MPSSGRMFAALAMILVIRAGAAQILPDATTQIAVEGTPGSAIFLDGARQGVVPRSGTFLIRNARAGKHEVRVEMDGKRPVAKSVSLATGQTARVQAILDDVTGSLEVFTAPGADVALNGKPAGKADGSGRLVIPGLKVLVYMIRASAAGYDPGERRVEMEPDVITSVTINLKPVESPLETGASLPAPKFAKHRRLAGHEDESWDIRGVVFQTAGELISWVGRIIQWDPETGRQLQTIDFRPAEYFIVSGDLRQVSFVRHEYNPERNYTSFVDMPTARKIVEGRSWSNLSSEIQGLAEAFSPDSTQLAVLVKDGAELWDVGTRKRLQTLRDPSIGQLAYSPDGHWIASGGGWSGSRETKIALWDLTTGQKVRELPPISLLRRLVFSSDNRWLAAVQDEKIELWEVTTGRRGRTLMIPGPSAPSFYDAVFTRDNGFLISSNSSSLYVWDVGTGRQVGKPVEQRSGHLALSPDDRWLAIAADRELTLWRRTP